MEQGPRQKPPPPPIPGSVKPANASRAPAAEGVMVRPGGMSEMLVGRLRSLLPQSARGTLSIDATGNISANGQRIGVHEGGRFLMEYGPMFSHIPFPVAMRAMVQAGKMKVFIEVTESEACICAGDKLGQKKLYSRIS